MSTVLSDDWYKCYNVSPRGLLSSTSLIPEFGTSCLKMVKQRWAALSVKDHINTAKLIPDILMYDRLVVPTCPPEQKDRWTKKEWYPDLQEKRLKKLQEGDLVEEVEWDRDNQIMFNKEARLVADKLMTR